MGCDQQPANDVSNGGARRDVFNSREARDKGFALVVVIWIGVLLALIAAAFTASVRSRVRETASHANAVRGEAVADAGARLAMLELLNAQATSEKVPRFRAGGTPVMCAVGSDASAVIRVDDEDGKINLNTSNRDLLTALFAGLGASPSDARRYGDRILDFRDADDDRRVDGAERVDYDKSAGIGPKNADFASVDELDQVQGIPPAIREDAKRYLTVAAIQDGFDPATAPEGLKPLIVRGAGGIVSAPADAAAPGAIEISSELPIGFTATSRRQVYAIRSEAVLDTGARFAREVIVMLPDGPEGTPLVQRWRRAPSILPANAIVPPPQQLPPC